MKLVKTIKNMAIGIGILIGAYLVLHSIAIYRYKLSPTAKIRWQNVENSYRVRHGMSYEEVLSLMGREPYDPDVRLINRIVDTSLLIVKESPEAYICINYQSPTISESTVAYWFDTNFVVSGISYYVDEYGNQPKKCTKYWWKIP